MHTLIITYEYKISRAKHEAYTRKIAQKTAQRRAAHAVDVKTILVHSRGSYATNNLSMAKKFKWIVGNLDSIASWQPSWNDIGKRGDGNDDPAVNDERDYNFDRRFWFRDPPNDWRILWEWIPFPWKEWINQSIQASTHLIHLHDEMPRWYKDDQLK